MQGIRIFRRNSLYSTGIALALFCAALPAHADPYPEPEVVIDISVLQALNPEPAPAGKTETPVQTPFVPSLTIPEAIAVLEEAGKPVVTPEQKPPVPKVVKAARALPAPRPDKKPETVKITAFPVQMKIRSESSDPAAASTSVPVAVVEKEEAPKSFDIAIPAQNADTAAAAILPMPEQDNIAYAPQSGDAQRIAALPVARDVPLPKRRPEKQLASKSFVDQARREAAQQMAVAAYTPKGRDGPAVPAVPAGSVSKEWLAPPVTPKPAKQMRKDELQEQLVNTDKSTFIKAVEAISGAIARRDVKDDKPDSATAAVSAIAPAAGTPKQKTQEKIIDITAPMPAAVAGNGKIPRPPPEESFEEDYVSLPFTPGIDGLDQEITSALQQDIVPALKQNPAWRLQIQAFASPTDEGVSSARRTSLSRALAVRSYLLDQGIEARRMDVRALGMQTDRNPADRVDLVLFDPDKI